MIGLLRLALKCGFSMSRTVLEGVHCDGQPVMQLKSESVVSAVSSKMFTSTFSNVTFFLVVTV